MITLAGKPVKTCMIETRD